MAHRYKVKSIPIQDMNDVSPGDIIFSPNEQVVIYLVACIKKITESKKTLHNFTLISSGGGKVYDLTEAYVGLLKMRKIIL